MKILYVSGTYMPASGGAEISMFSLLKELPKQGISVTIITSDQVPPDETYAGNVNLSVVHSNRLNLPSLLANCLAQNPVDVVVTQNLWTDIALRAAFEASIPSLYYARTAFGDIDFRTDAPATPTRIVANSQAVADFIFQRWQRKAAVIRSIINFDDYRISENSLRYITMVNPIALKGGHIFKAIAQRMPDHEFLAVKGWGHLRSENGWNKILLRDLTAGFGDDSVWVPEEVDLDDLSNVHMVPTAPDMREIYRQTRILLVPSITGESIPRVALEAMSNGIPVLGSRVGGIPEALNSKGIVIDEFENPDRWVDAIRGLSNKNEYLRVSSQCREGVRNIDFSAQIHRFIAVLKEAAHGIA